jgi:hypothetical protein
MGVKLVVADDNRIYLAVVDEDGDVVHVFSPQDTSAHVGGEVTALTGWRG